MHRKTSKRSVPLTEKLKHPELPTDMTVQKQKENGFKNHCPMVPAQKPFAKSAANMSHHPWAKAEDDSWSWDRRSSGTSISWPEEMEEVATKKVIDQWEAVERTLYDEDNQVTSESLRSECIQWRTQLPHLRVIGKGLQRRQVVDANSDNLAPVDVKEKEAPSTVEEIIEEHKVPTNGEEDASDGRNREETRNEVLDMILDFVCAQLLADNEVDESLSQNLDAVLRITPAPTYSGRNPLGNHRTANEFVGQTHRNSKLHKNEREESSDALEVSGCLPEVRKNSFHAEKSATRFSVGKGSIMPISARRQRNMRERTSDCVSANTDRLYTPQLPRNALGTVFTEKIIVSPVPFATSTKESFSTLKSTPLTSMRLSLESSLGQRSARSVNSGFKTTSARRVGLLEIPQVHSAWQTPVCPTVWPKNVKLAPIDITRLPSSQRRSLATSFSQPRRSRNSLSPIPREIMPISPLANRAAERTCLEIHGKRIVRQKSRMNVTSAGWEFSSRNVKKIGNKVKNNDAR
ncbi:uncharacterized protein LOC124407298 [Diprion similis]|uniref:uncharacterized protein LOC124407298 n=1 Tax=Diprion similis TaxID=362088 RepID=UPI001EF938B2|nr:uncharacterized protein LOC124407298 [Diprion similis]